MGLAKCGRQLHLSCITFILHSVMHIFLVYTGHVFKPASWKSLQFLWWARSSLTFGFILIWVIDMMARCSILGFTHLIGVSYIISSKGSHAAICSTKKEEKKKKEENTLLPIFCHIFIFKTYRNILVPKPYAPRRNFLVCRRCCNRTMVICLV